MMKSVLNRLRGDFITYSVLDSHFVESEMVSSVKTECKAYDTGDNILSAYHSARGRIFNENHQVFVNFIKSGEGTNLDSLLDSDGSLYVGADHLKFVIAYLGDRFVPVDDFDTYCSGNIGNYIHNGVHIRIFADEIFEPSQRFIPASFTFKLADINGKFCRKFAVTYSSTNDVPSISFTSYIKSNKVRYLYDGNIQSGD